MQAGGQLIAEETHSADYEKKSNGVRYRSQKTSTDAGTAIGENRMPMRNHAKTKWFYGKLVLRSQEIFTRRIWRSSEMIDICDLWWTFRQPQWTQCTLNVHNTECTSSITWEKGTSALNPPVAVWASNTSLA
jgi:hypothetical protein